MGFQNLHIKDFYETQDYAGKFQDVIEDFYIPVLTNSILYEREAGYFTSSILNITYKALPSFISNGGKIKIICNHELSNEDDIKVADSGFRNQNLIDDFDSLLSHYDTRKRTQLFCSLIERDILDIKICITKTGIYHKKVGILTDKQGNIISFKGGVNETYSGWKRNYDSIDVEKSYDGGNLARIESNKNNFNALWNDNKQSCYVYGFDDAFKKNILKNSFSTDGILLRELEEQIEKENEIKNNSSHSVYSSTKRKQIDDTSDKISLKPHQQRAFEVWEQNNYKSIIRYCTGSGKTFIALKAINHMLDKGYKPIVIVPSIALLEQWYEQIEKFCDCQTLKCGGDSGKAKYSKYLKVFTKHDNDNLERHVTIAVMRTASSETFTKTAKFGSHSFLIVDECHRLWAKTFNKILDESIINWADCPRLALSATPEDRTFDSNEENEEEELYIDDKYIETGKVNIFEFFHGIRTDNSFDANISYDLSDAIRDEILCPYEYHVSTAYLDIDETREFIKISKEISKLSAILSTNSKESGFYARRKLLITQRARIIKTAKDKRRALINILKNDCSGDSSKLNEEHWLIYVGPGRTDDRSEIEFIDEQINDELGITPIKYYSEVHSRGNQMEFYKNSPGGICLACDMLDEGVDIPFLSKGIILASSKNPRQYIQRRGRLLRKDDRLISKKKSKAIIWDIITLPEPAINDRELDYYYNHIIEECNRAEQFAVDALNYDIVINDIERIKIRYT